MVNFCKNTSGECFEISDNAEADILFSDNSGS